MSNAASNRAPSSGVSGCNHALSSSPAWWSKLLSLTSQAVPTKRRSSSSSSKARNLRSRSGRGSFRRDSTKTKMKSICEETARTASSASSLGDTERSEPNRPTSPSSSNPRRARENRDVLSEALHVSRGAEDSVRQDPGWRRGQQQRRRQPEDDNGDDEGLDFDDIQRRRSRSPVLPVVRSCRRGYDGDCCPACDKAANAHAEEMYAHATWRMYDRIMRARATSAAAMAQQAAMMGQLECGVPMTVAVPQAAYKVPLPPGVEEQLLCCDLPLPAGHAEHQEEEEEDGVVFSLDLDR